jgi:tRNA1Val (adenine37-N6)-methyltransferase
MQKNQNLMQQNSDVHLLDGERIDDLQYNGLKIIQNASQYCFSSDAVLLCNFVKAGKNDSIVDLCSGSGVVGILAQAKTGAKKLVMVEKQPQLADMCARSLVLNNLQNQAQVLNIDACDAPKVLGNESFDVVCANPPYYLTNGKKLSGRLNIDMAKFEIDFNFDKLCQVTSKILKYGGKFFTINDSSRIAELLTTLNKYNLQPKIIQFIYPKSNFQSNVVLIQATKCGKAGAKVYYKKI